MPQLTKIITLNLNGIRSAATKGFFDWLLRQQADVICVQETKAQMHVLTEAKFRPEGYHCYFHDAIKKGYSGVGIFTRQEPLAVKTGLGWAIADEEGRYIQADFEGYSVASLYMPSGTSGPERQAHKIDFMTQYLPLLKNIHDSQKNVIICGDWNIAHQNIDLKNWRSNQKNSGFLPEERAWLDELFDRVGMIDAFRVVNQQPDQYTWWSHRGQAWANNVGWRIDYQIVTPALKDKVCTAAIYKDEKFSDHAPLIMEYDL
ncbi:MAG: exodeoxyribonuclease III [Gammaproteobacteria bacterium]